MTALATKNKLADERLSPASIASIILGFLLTLYCQMLPAEQSKRVGPYTVHYVAFPTTFLSPEIAQQYNIVRGKDRALVNLSILDSEGVAIQANLSGTMKNLPGQVLPLNFVEVKEGDALYYLASARFTDQEIVRFNIEFVPKNSTANSAQSYTLDFQQKLYWDQ